VVDKLNFIPYLFYKLGTRVWLYGIALFLFINVKTRNYEDYYSIHCIFIIIIIRIV